MCLYRKKYYIYRTWYYPWFQASIGGLGTYFPQIRGPLYTQRWDFLMLWWFYPKSWFWFFFLNFTYLWLRWFFVRTFSICCEEGTTFCCASRTSHCSGFCCHGARALGCVGSEVAAPRFHSKGSIVVVHGLSCPEAWGVLTDRESNRGLLHWQVNSSPLSHQGTPILRFLRNLHLFSVVTAPVYSYQWYEKFLFLPQSCQPLLSSVILITAILRGISL